MGARSRRKGAAFEREVCKLLEHELGVPCARNLVQTREGGYDIDTELPVAIECKRVESGFTASHLKQARRQAGDRIPVVAHRRSREPVRFVVEMDAEQFCEWLKGAAGAAACGRRECDRPRETPGNSNRALQQDAERNV